MNLVTNMLVTAVMAFSSARAPTQAGSKLVAFNENAMRLDVVLAELSKRSSMVLNADNSLKHQVVLLRTAKSLPVTTIMGKLAEVTDGKWTVANGRVTLSGNPAIGSSRAFIQARSIKISKAIEAMFAADSSVPFDSKAAVRLLRDLSESDALREKSDSTGEAWFRRMTHIAAASPEQRLLGRAIRTVDVRDIASAKVGSSIFYGLPANKLEALLRIRNEDLAQAQRDVDLWQEFLARNPDDNRPSYFGDPRVIRPLGRIQRVLLSLKVLDADRIVCRLIGATSNGQTIVTASAEIRVDTLGLPTGPEADSLTKNADLNLTALSAEHLKLMNLTAEDRELPAVDADWSERLRSPSQFEPASYATSELLRGVFGDGPVIASIPDSLLSMPKPVALAGEVNRLRFAAYMRSRADISISSADGWTMIKPSDPNGSKPIDRMALGKLLDCLSKKPCPSIADYSEMAQTVDQEQLAPLFWRSKYSLSSRPDAMNPQNWPSYRFYGSLSQSQQTSLRNGSSIPVNQLSALAREHLTTCILAGAGYSGSILPRVHGFEIKSLPTERLTNGLDGTSFLASNAKLSPGILFEYQSPKGALVLAPIIATDSGVYVPSSAYDKDASYLPMTQASLNLNVSLGESFMFSTTLSEYQWNSNQRKVKFEQLDEKLRGFIEARRREIWMSRNRDSVIGGNGLQKPPPP